MDFPERRGPAQVMKPFPLLLIYRKQLGDLVLLQPAIQLLAERHGAEILLRTREGFADVLSLMPGRVSLAGRVVRPLGQVFCFDTKWSSLSDALLALPAKRHLVLTRPDRAWWHPLFFSALWNVSRKLDEYRGLAFHRTLGGKDFKPPRLNMPPADWQPSGLPERYFLLHPTSAWQRKTWPASSWIAMLERLLMASDLPLVVTSGNEAWEQEMAAEIASRFPDRLINLGGKTSLRAYLSLLAKAELVLTVDGSASHLAAAFGRRVLTLFGPTNPLHWHFPTARSTRLSAADYVGGRRPPVAAIPVEDVFRAATALLETGIDG